MQESGAMSGDDERKIKNVIYGVLEAGKNRNFSLLSKLYAGDDTFSKFDDTPPYSRQTVEEAIAQEEIAFASLSDYQYAIRELKIDLIGVVAIATFYLDYGGVLVNNYTFEGRTISISSRATYVLEKRASGWVVVHKHISRLPDDWKH